jgi:hypothetical protein
MISDQYGVFDRRKHCGKQVGFQHLAGFFHKQDFAIESAEKIEVARQVRSCNTDHIGAREYTMTDFGSDLADFSCRLLEGLEIGEQRPLGLSYDLFFPL